MKRPSVIPSQTVFALVLSMTLTGGCFLYSGTGTDGDPDETVESIAFTVEVSSENPVFRPALQFRASGEDAAASAVPVTVTIDYGDGVTHTETVETSSYLPPTHRYQTSASPRTALLTVSPWEELTVLNLGFREGDDGNNIDKTEVPLIDVHPPEEGSYENLEYDQLPGAIWGYAGKVLAVSNLQAAVNLQAFCCEWQPIVELDLSGLSKLRTLEGFLSSIKSANFQGCAELRRCCLEQTGANASWRMEGGTRIESEELDLRDSPLLQDIRGTGDDHVRIRLAEGAKATLWHLCKMENGRMGEIAFGDGEPEIFDLSDFPALQECWVAGSPFLPPQLVISNPVTVSLYGWGSGVTSVDASGQEQLLDLRLGGSALTAVNIEGCTRLETLYLQNSGLSETMVDSILETLDSFGTSVTPGDEVSVDLTSAATDEHPNAAPSAAALVHLESLRSRGWVILTNE